MSPPSTLLVIIAAKKRSSKVHSIRFRLTLLAKAVGSDTINLLCPSNIPGGSSAKTPLPSTTKPILDLRAYITTNIGLIEIQLAIICLKEVHIYCKHEVGCLGNLAHYNVSGNFHHDYNRNYLASPRIVKIKKDNMKEVTD